MLEIAGVGAVRRPRKPVVAADQHAHSALAQLRENPLRVLELTHHAGFLGVLIGDAPGLRFVHELVQQPDRRCDEDPVASGLQEVEALLVGVLAVIEDVDLVLERQLDRRGCAHVGGDTLAVRVRGVAPPWRARRRA